MTFAYLLLLLPALVALEWGRRQIVLKEPPARPMRTLQLGTLVTDPAAKLVLAHQQGWMAVIFALALMFGPWLAGF